MTSISWLENHLFLTAHASSSADPRTPLSIDFHLITRNPQSSNSFMFQKLPEVCSSFSSNRLPPYCSMQRLKDFPPNIQDLIIVVSTASADVGLFTRAKVPLTNEHDTQKVINTFTATAIADDARRASLPIKSSGEGADTSSVGVALDLSSKEKVKRPLPQEEFDESSGPLPGLMILNEEGILSSWWVIYADSIRQNLSYPGLVNVRDQQLQSQVTQQGSPFAAIDSKGASSFGQPSFGGTAIAGNSFGKPPSHGFGAPSTPSSGFNGGFGMSSGLGKPQSPWGTNLPGSATPQTMTPAFGQPAFGSPSALGGNLQGPAFGAAGALGNRVSLWGTSASAPMNTFGGLGGGAPRGGAGTGAVTAFGTSSANTSGFASFANSPGFAGAAAQGGGGGSVFGKANPQAPLDSGMETESSFGGISRKPEETSGGLFKADGFKLGSTFKGDGTAANDLPKPSTNISGSLFGSNFAQTLGEKQEVVPPATTQEAQMNDSMSDYGSKNPSPIERESMSPVIQPTAPESQFPSAALPTSGGRFGTQAQSETTPAAVESSVPLVSSPGKPSVISTTPQDTPRKPGEVAPAVTVKSEPKEDTQNNLDHIPRSPSNDPLPPEATSKVSYSAGDSSNSPKSTAEDAPLPPDFLPPKRKHKDPPEAPPEVSALPEDDEDDRLDDDEGSGVDVAQELSPMTDPAQSPKISPESSFGALVDKTPVIERFTKVQPQQPRQSTKPLFGEVGSSATSYPFLPPPSKTQESPRSPSPVRPLLTAQNLRSEHARSMSAPGRPAKAIADRRQAMGKVTNERLAQPLQGEQRNQQRDLRLLRQAQKAAEEEQDLSDREDEKVREELATEVEATKVLEPFLAHQDYVGTVSKPGIPGQIEAVYRDINSMIDTLGINARSLKAFVTGHSEFYKDGGRSLEDLESPDWSMSEIDELEVIETQLFRKVEDGRVADVQGKLNICREIRKELHRMRSKRHEIARAINAQSDRHESEAVNSTPLGFHQNSIQHELRRDFSRVQKLLAEAEEGITMLRVTLASRENSKGKTHSLKKPTVEAVTNTIKKMTSMIERKTLDIDVLEVKMGRLGLFPGSIEGNREASVPLSPYSKKSPIVRDGGRGRHSFTPERSNGVSLKATNPGSPRKGMDSITNEEVERYRAKVQQRRAVGAIFKKVFLDGGPRVRPLES